jgi:hypothetical protein
MVKIPRRGVRALPRAFNAHNFCVIENCHMRAIARVRLVGVLLDVCRVHLPTCPKGITVLVKIR